MIYLDNGATSFPKPPQVIRAAAKAMACAANPGRGGYEAAMEAARTVFDCREQAAGLFSCSPEQVVLTANCTHGLNIAIESIIKPGSRVLVSGFEHNAVMRPLYARDCRVTVAGRRLFCRDALLEEFRAALRQGMDGAVFTHVSNVFGFILPVQEMAALCRAAGVPIGIAVGANSEEDVLFWLNRGIQFISAGSDLSAISSAAHAQSAMMRRVVEKLK